MLDRVPERMGGEMPMLRYQATQMLMWPGKLGLMQAAAEQRTGATQADAKTLKLDLIRDAKRAYWMLRLNQRQGVGSDVAKRIAAPMWGGLVSLTLLTLLLVPAVYVIWRSFELRRSPVAT